RSSDLVEKYLNQEYLREYAIQTGAFNDALGDSGARNNLTQANQETLMAALAIGGYPALRQYLSWARQHEVLETAMGTVPEKIVERTSGPAARPGPGALEELRLQFQAYAARRGGTSR